MAHPALCNNMSTRKIRGQENKKYSRVKTIEFLCSYILLIFVQKHRETGTIENLQKELVGEAERLDIKDKAVLVLCELLLGDNILQEVKTHRLLFLRVSLFYLTLS